MKNLKIKIIITNENGKEIKVSNLDLESYLKCKENHGISLLDEIVSEVTSEFKD